jgi:membrane protein DedA with SNARE-associated domain
METFLIDTLTNISGPALYAFIFAATFLECSAFLGLIFPATLVVIMAGILAKTSGAVRVDYAFLSAFLGGYAGDLVGFWLGRLFHSPILLWVKAKWPLLPVDEKIEESKQFLGKHGKWAIIIGQFFGPLRSLLPFTMGSLHFPRLFFFVLDFFGILFLVGVLFGSGWMIGEAWESVKSDFFKYFYSVLFVIATLFYLFFQKKS